MALMKIVESPDSFLSQKCRPVSDFNKGLHELASDMFETMYESEGIGLAAIQVGVLSRVIVMDIQNSKAEVEAESGAPGLAGPAKVCGGKYVMINPEVFAVGDKLSSYDEGCLSFPGESVIVKRPAVIDVKYQGLDGKQHEVHMASGLLATCIQHELDHLNGVTILDHLSPLRRRLMEKRLLKRARLKR